MNTFLKRALLALVLGLAGSAVAQNAPPRASGQITTQNLVPTGTATTGSCVTIPFAGMAAANVQVTGTYTGALSLQRTVNGTTWETLSASTTFTNVAGTQTATIGSGTTGTFETANINGANQVRVCGLGAMSGTANVSIQASASGGGGGSSGGGGGGGAVTIADGADVTLGAQADAVAASDTATASLVALIKRLNQNVNTVDTIATATLSNVAASASSVTCLASNGSRRRAVIYNDSATATLYVKAGTTASATSFTWLLLPGATLSLDSFPIYTGVLDCIWSAASGNARVTEF